MLTEANIVYKKIGETPLEALERFRVLNKIPENIPMTYAGRLDPMAEGKLIILVGEECKNKEKYLGLDKEYEVEIVLGIETDTYDGLGLVTSTNNNKALLKLDELEVAASLGKYIGKIDQKYPAFSSKTVKGSPLHSLARSGDLPDEMPTKTIQIYEIELLGSDNISSQDLLSTIDSNISKVGGDFRQSEILDTWHQKLAEDRIYNMIKIRVKCSSGSYMRSLAHRIGGDFGIGGFALSIKRTWIGGL